MLYFSIKIIECVDVKGRNITKFVRNTFRFFKMCWLCKLSSLHWISFALSFGTIVISTNSIEKYGFEIELTQYGTKRWRLYELQKSIFSTKPWCNADWRFHVRASIKIAKSHYIWVTIKRTNALFRLHILQRFSDRITRYVNMFFLHPQCYSRYI